MNSYCEVRSYKDNLQLLHSLLDTEVVENFQKAKTCWLIHGDQPSKKLSFQNVIKRQNKTSLPDLMDDNGSLISDPHRLKEEAILHFTNYSMLKIMKICA